MEQALSLRPLTPTAQQAPGGSRSLDEKIEGMRRIEQEQAPGKKRIIQRATRGQALKLLIPFAGILTAYGVHLALPNVHPEMYTAYYWAPFLLIATGLYLVCYLVSLFLVPVRNRLLRFSYLLCFVFLFIEVYDVATLKTGTLRMPFMPSPDMILSQYVLNFPKILEASLASLQLLLTGFSIGLGLGLLSGILSGCSRLANYWIAPLLKLIGPVPGLVWLPLLVVSFSSSYIGSVAAIVVAVWFPITLMLSNALKNTSIDLIERGETLGASKPFIILHVMLPAAVPALANALFMALAGSFGALSAAELSGVKAGLAVAVKQMGTIVNFGSVFAYVLMMILIFSSLTMIMFAVRNRLVRWQKGLVRW